MANRDNFEEKSKGVQRIFTLPSKDLDGLWESIVMDEAIKKQLLLQAIMNFTVRQRVPRSVLPLHGTILLKGPPGTGKTTLARGLAQRAAQSLKGAKLKLIEIDPHGLASSMLGQTQKAVSQLFAQTIAEAATGGPLIVLLDEVETLAVDRSKLSMQANPVDVHRATDAVLVQLDLLADEHPNLLFVATSNFPQALDGAFTSRCDLILDIPLPDQAACQQILADCLSGLAETYPTIKKLASSSELPKLAAGLHGLDGRAIRKTVASAFAMRQEVAIDPSNLEMADLLQAVKASKHARTLKEKA